MRRSPHKAKGSKQAAKRVQAVERGRKGKAAEGVKPMKIKGIRKICEIHIDAILYDLIEAQINRQLGYIGKISEFYDFYLLPRKTRRLQKGK